MNRRFLLSGGLAVSTVPALGLDAAWSRAHTGDAPGLPPVALHDVDEEGYWARVREQFLIPKEYSYLNNGTCGATPMPVLNAVFDAYRLTEQMTQEDPDDYPVFGYDAWNEYRDPLAAFIGCKRDELALMRNTTEGNSYIANGLDLKPGDEVLMTDQEHTGGRSAWELRAKRYGIVVRKVKLPAPAASADEVLNLFNDAITPRTRVMFFSHITSGTGTVLPAKALCALARTKGILSAIDGAHVVGMMPLDVHALGCDMYTSSPHKWLQAPKGTGLLYIRDEVIGRMWGTVATEGWDDPSLHAERFQRVGTASIPTLAGLNAAVRFASEIGMERIERRHRKLADHVIGALIARGATPLTSPDAALRCAITAIEMPGVEQSEFVQWLWRQRRVRVKGSRTSRIRISTSYYTLRRDIDRFLAAFDEFPRPAR